MATAIASNRASSASAGRKAHCPASLPRCSLRGRSGARHAHVAARGSAPPIPFAARRGDRFPGRDGKAGSSIELESCAPAGRPSVMHFYSGPPMHLLSGVDTPGLRQIGCGNWPRRHQSEMVPGSTFNIAASSRLRIRRSESSIGLFTCTDKGLRHPSKRIYRG